MTMNRRNVLVGLGTAAVGTGAAFGSGAFTQIEADREVNVEIADDSEAAIAFEEEEDGVENSQLHIDLSDINEDSTITIGEHDGSEVSNPAFTVQNNTDEATQFENGVSVDISAEADLDAAGAEIEFHAENNNGDFEELTDSSLNLVDESDSADVAVEIDIATEEIDDEQVTFTAEVAE